MSQYCRRLDFWPILKILIPFLKHSPQCFDWHILLYSLVEYTWTRYLILRQLWILCGVADSGMVLFSLMFDDVTDWNDGNGFLFSLLFYAFAFVFFHLDLPDLDLDLLFLPYLLLFPSSTPSWPVAVDMAPWTASSPFSNPWQGALVSLSTWLCPFCLLFSWFWLLCNPVIIYGSHYTFSNVGL